MRYNINKKHVLVLPKAASRLAVNSYKNIRSLDFDTRPLKKAHYVALAVMVVAPTLSTGLLDNLFLGRYKLTEAEKKIVAKSSVEVKHIRETSSAYTYNKEDDKLPGDNPALKQLSISSEKDSTGDIPYQATINKDPSEGISFGDSYGDRNFSIKPLFNASRGRINSDNQIIFPTDSTNRHIYVFKKNGIKGDITFTEKPKPTDASKGDILRLDYEIDLPDNLAIKMLPDGGVGLYSSDPTLYGNVQVSDDKSKELLDNARKNSQKNTLAFIIPRPFIIDESGVKNFDDVNFVLEGVNEQGEKIKTDTGDSGQIKLTIVMSNIRNLSYPLSIDPTIIVNTSNDFNTDTGDGNGNVRDDGAGTITRDGVGTGALDTWKDVYEYATGGVVSNIKVGEQYYRVHTFDTIGANTFVAKKSLDIEYLVIGGGGGGGGASYVSVAAGGGGGGGAVSGSASISAGTYTATVGGGGSGGVGSTVAASVGGSSQLNGISQIASGGGGGGNFWFAPSSGASGGGAGENGSNWDGASALSTQGCNGGNDSGYNNSTVSVAGGGGGAGGAAGSDGTSGGCVGGNSGLFGAWFAGNGGRGFRSSITGVSLAYGGGGGGGTHTNVGGNGGDGGGGEGAGPTSGNGVSGTSYGGGGGGAMRVETNLVDVPYTGGSGHKGVVIVRYKISPPPRALYSHSTVVYNGYVYIINGIGDNGSNTNDIYYASLSPSGELSDWKSYYDSYATGGDRVYTFVGDGTNGISGQTYRVHVFTKVGNSTFTANTTLSNVEYLVVGGGGAGGNGGGGGGGAGGYRTSVPDTFYTVGTASQSGTTVTGAGTAFLSTMVGGVITFSGGQKARITAFNSATSLTVDVSQNVSSTSYSIGYGTSGGGAAVESTLNNLSGAYTVTVGAGANYVGNSDTNSANAGRGGDSVFSTITATGGGNGSTITGFASYTGGSGGGGGFNSFGSISDNGKAGVSPTQGYAGGSQGTGCTNSNLQGSGGGGAGGAGGQCSVNPNSTGGNGGAGKESYATGVLAAYAGGGGGGGQNTAGTAPLTSPNSLSTGAGPGSTDAGTVAQDARDSTGSGGGSGINTRGGKGGSGIVVVRYPVARPYYARQNSTSVVYNGYLYVIGGFRSTVSNTNCSSVSSQSCNDVWYSKINSTNGSLGTFTQTTSFNVPRSSHTAVAYNGYLYITGGTTELSGGDCNSVANNCNGVQYAPVNANGSLGTWNYTSNSLNNSTSFSAGFTTPRNGHSSIVYNGYIYILAGQQNANYYNDIQYARINADGTISSWASAGSSFTTARSNSAVTVYKGYIYIIGGANASTAYADTQYAQLNADGTIGEWITDSSIGTARQLHTPFVANGKIYFYGGAKTSNTSCTYTNTASTRCLDIQSVELKPGKGTGWSSATALPTATAEHATVAAKGYLYVIGGVNVGTPSFTATRNIRYATIGNDGTVTWNATTLTYTPALSSIKLHAATEYNGYLYVSGGIKDGSLTNEVYYAYICDGTTKGGCTAGSTELGKLGTWNQASSLNATRSFHGMAAYNDYIYTAGGKGAATAYRDIQYARICNGVDRSNGCSSTEGSLGEWRYTYNSAATSSFVEGFSTNRVSIGFVIHNGYMYVTGGCDFGITTSYGDVQYAPINNDGTVGAWGATSNPSPIGASNRCAHATVVSNGYLYMIAGFDASISSTLVRTLAAPINNNGTLGSFFEANVGLGTAVRNMGYASYNGYIFLTGGYNSVTSTLTTVSRNRVGPQSGETSTWTTDAGATYASDGKFNHASIAYNGYIYVLGGRDSVGTTNTVTYAAINADGSIAGSSGTWATTTSFTTARRAHSAFAYNGYMYIMGGISNIFTNQADHLKDVQYAPINSDGSLGQWSYTNSLLTARRGFPVAVYGDFVYVFGGGIDGTTNTNKIERARICSGLYSNGLNGCGLRTGELGAWTNIKPMRDELISHSAFIYNNYVYILGGRKSGGTTFSNVVEYAPMVNSSYGSVDAVSDIGDWKYTNFLFENGLYGAAAVVVNNSVYLIGGQNSGLSTKNSILQASINSDGTLSSWSKLTNNLTTARHDPNAVYYNGYIYTIGGWNGNSGSPVTYNSVEYTPIKTQTNNAVYERLVDVGSSGATINGFFITGSTKCAYRVTYRTAESSAVNTFSAPVTLANVMPLRTQPISQASKQFIHFSITMNDEICGSTSDITSIQIIYNDVPSAPSLSSPANGETNVKRKPEFVLGTTDTYKLPVRYKIEVCSTSNCSSIVATIDQTSTLNGWNSYSTGNSAASAYDTGALQVAQYARHKYQLADLNPSTTYYWRAYAIPAPYTNASTWSSASAIQSFITESATPKDINIGGGTTIYGGTTIQPSN